MTGSCSPYFCPAFFACICLSVTKALALGHHLSARLKPFHCSGDFSCHIQESIQRAGSFVPELPHLQSLFHSRHHFIISPAIPPWQLNSYIPHPKHKFPLFQHLCSTTALKLPLTFLEPSPHWCLYFLPTHSSSPLTFPYIQLRLYHLSLQ